MDLTLIFSVGALIASLIFISPNLKTVDELNEEQYQDQVKTERREKELEFQIRELEFQAYNLEQEIRRNKQAPTTGFLVLESKNGGGWWFIFDNKAGMWTSGSAFPGRVTEVEPGKYSIAFDDFYGNGSPGNKSEYKVVSVEAGDIVTVKVDMMFKNEEKREIYKEKKKQERREEQLWNAVLSEMAKNDSPDVETRKFGDYKVKSYTIIRNNKPEVKFKDYPDNLKWWR